MTQQHRFRQGFTLVEMSIVLAIIALIVGGILTGEKLLHNAKLRSIYTDAEVYMRAVEQFSEKYGSLPGDMYNATSIWGAQDSGDGLGVDCTDSASTDEKTCNGDGDGFIADDAGATAYEIFRLWQHLSNAGLTDATYTGARSGTSTNFQTDIGTNAPGSGYAKQAGFNFRYHAAGGGQLFTDTENATYLIFGKESGTSYNNFPVLSTKDAWSIDEKIDDGLPGQGTVVTHTNTAGSNCASTDVSATATYQLSNLTELACTTYFKANF